MFLNGCMDVHCFSCLCAPNGCWKLSPRHKQRSWWQTSRGSSLAQKAQMFLNECIWMCTVSLACVHPMIVENCQHDTKADDRQAGGLKSGTENTHIFIWMYALFLFGNSRQSLGAHRQEKQCTPTYSHFFVFCAKHDALFLSCAPLFVSWCQFSTIIGCTQAREAARVHLCVFLCFLLCAPKLFPCSPAVCSYSHGVIGGISWISWWHLLNLLNTDSDKMDAGRREKQCTVNNFVFCVPDCFPCSSTACSSICVACYL